MATYRVSGTGANSAIIHCGVAPQIGSERLSLEVNTNLPVGEIKACWLAILADMEKHGIYDETRAKADRARMECEPGIAQDGNEQKGSDQ